MKKRIEKKLFTKLEVQKILKIKKQPILIIWPEKRLKNLTIS